jgi:hypothetical protein
MSNQLYVDWIKKNHSTFGGGYELPVSPGSKKEPFIHFASVSGLFLQDAGEDRWKWG